MDRIFYDDCEVDLSKVAASINLLIVNESNLNYVSK